MITPTKNESLVEGHSILSRYDSTYDPSDKSTYNRYTFDFVQKALKDYNADFYIEDFIRTLIFDAIIGNSDRHQSNWGLIQIIDFIENKPVVKGRKLPFAKTKKDDIPDNNINIVKKSAPIYDSGCCLGREFGEQQIQEHLDIQSKFDKYIRSGVSELRTDETGKKPTHEELLKFIKNTNNGEWKSFMENEINKVLQKYDSEVISLLISNIDYNLPQQYKERYGLTVARKEFVCRVINTIINNLKNI